MLGRNGTDLVDLLTSLDDSKHEERILTQVLDPSKLPRHVAIIMDGNGRWAKERGLPRSEGHKAGIEAVKRAVRGCINFGVEYLTVYAFSTENWRRPHSEVRYLMQLLLEGFRNNLYELENENIRVTVIGLKDRLPEKVTKAAQEAMQRTAGNDGLKLQIALNYGSRAEIVSACRQVVEAIQAGKLRLDDLDEEIFASFLFTRGIPDPDLIIRTGGECRLSNFLLWQAAYAEIWITDLKWPDFTEDTLLEALQYYANRERRFGGLGPKA